MRESAVDHPCESCREACLWFGSLEIDDQSRWLQGL